MANTPKILAKYNLAAQLTYQSLGGPANGKYWLISHITFSANTVNTPTVSIYLSIQGSTLIQLLNEANCAPGDLIRVTTIPMIYQDVLYVKSKSYSSDIVVFGWELDTFKAGLTPKVLAYANLAAETPQDLAAPGTGKKWQVKYVNFCAKTSGQAPVVALKQTFADASVMQLLYNSTCASGDVTRVTELVLINGDKLTASAATYNADILVVGIEETL